MTISTQIYANLSPIERIRAAVSATARDDHAELQILKDTCPKKTFLMTDPAYSEGMERLFSLVLVLELDLASYALDFQTARLRQGMKRCDIQECALKATASLVAAMDQLFEEMGLDPQAIAKSSPPRHPYVYATIRMSEGEADPDLVAAYLQGMREILPTC
jgi:hypothetical protein